MGFQSYSDYLNKVTNLGQIGTISWQKTLGNVVTYVAGRWYNTAYMGGNPMPNRPGERMANGQLVGLYNSGGNPANWTLGANWFYANATAATNAIVHTSGATATAVASGTQNIVVGNNYGVEFWTQAWGTANFTVSIGGTNLTATAATGQYHFVVSATNSTDLTVTPLSTNTSTISNFSVVLLGYGVPLFGTDVLGGIPVGSAVSPATKHVLTTGVMSPAANFVPGNWKLVDMLMAHPVNMNTALPQSLIPLSGQINVAFQNGGGAWTYGSGWAYSSATSVTATTPSGTLSLPVANFSTPSAVSATQNAPIVGYSYNISYQISNLSGSGTITASIGGGTSTATTLANSIIDQTVTAVNTTGALTFTVTGSASFTLTMIPYWASQAFTVSSGSPWTYGTGWSYTSATSATGANASGALALTVAQMSASNVPVIGCTYSVTFNLTLSSGSGTIVVSMGGATASAITIANGYFTVQLTAVNTTGALQFTTTGTVTVVVANVNVNIMQSTVAGDGVEVGLPRYASGAGVKAMLCWHSGAWQAASNAASSAFHTIGMTYTNSAGVSGRSLPITVAGLTGGVPAMGHIDHSGVAANNMPGPFLPLQSGDVGVQSIQTFTLSAVSGSNNYATLILCKELLSIPNMAVYVGTERDLMNQIRSLPQIQDGANLAWLFMPFAATAATTSAYGWIDYVWG